MKKIFYSMITGIIAVSCSVSPDKDKVTIYLNEKGAPVAPSMYGVFFEEINHAGDGGLYAELVQNRSFEELEIPDGYHTEGNKLIPGPVKNHLTGQIPDRSYEWNTEPVRAWSLTSGETQAARMRLTKDRPKFASAPNNLEVTISDASCPVQLINEGYWGMGIAAGEKYHLRVIIRTAPGYQGSVVAKLLSAKGDILASAPVEPAANQWTDFKTVLTSNGKDSGAKLALEFNAPGKIWLDYVSLFPEHTYMNRPNGLRNDVAGILAALKPAFFRWPGGCVVEGVTLTNRYDWKKTLGDPAARPGEYSTWGYRCSYGFGYYEMLQFCEDIHADAMYVCNAGLGCQFRMGDACTDHEIDFFIDDCLHAIEYAIGGTDTEWGARRASDGHPQPFPLKYVEVGNENWGPEYDHRFDLFYKAIKEKYPQITVIYNEMPQREGPAQIAMTDMIDPHWYESPEFFYKNTHLFDDYPRGKYTVYVGEYACNKGVGAGNMKAALSEAAFIGGMERNGDLVTMTSYAPLFENVHNRKWTTNLIWIDSDRVMGRSSYYVQKMASENRPAYNVKNSAATVVKEAPVFETGGIGLGAWETNVEYKDIVIADNGKTIPADISRFTFLSGSWNTDYNTLNQTSLEPRTKSLLKGFSGGHYTFEFDARKLSGREGFLVFFGMTGDGKEGYMYNIGGWSNRSTALQQISNGMEAGVVSKRVNQSIETGKWYHLKVIVSPQKSELYMDGELILTHVPEAVPLQFVNTGYDDINNELIVKVVNGSGEKYPVAFEIKGASNIPKTGKVISLASGKAEEENTLDNPLKISPVESEFVCFGKRFDYDFPPFSYTILRIKAKQ